MSRERNSKEEWVVAGRRRKDRSFFQNFHGSWPSFRHPSSQRFPTVPRKDKYLFHHHREQQLGATDNNHGFNPHPHHQHRHRSPENTRAGHRGFSRLPWRSVPREPPLLEVGGRNGSPTTLFVDNLPHGMAREWLSDIFAEFGRVEDVYISKKVRKSKKDDFAFVRFRRWRDAEAAISKLNGLLVKGKMLTVSLAKYNRSGSTLPQMKIKQQKPDGHAKRSIKFPALRDKRRYADVVNGKQSSNVDGNIIPVLFTINLPQNQEIVDKLKCAVIAEKAVPLCFPQVVKDIDSFNIPLIGMNSLSPCKIILFFDNENAMNDALGDGSQLWHIFDDVRQWSEGESFNDRLVWIECFGLDPKCWSLDNIKTIGEKWGPVLYIDQTHDNPMSLTHARMLIRTKAQNRIDVRIRVMLDRGGCDVWVKESGDCGCNIHGIISNEFGKDPHEVDVSIAKGGCDEAGRQGNYGTMDNNADTVPNPPPILAYTQPLVDNANDMMVVLDREGDAEQDSNPDQFCSMENLIVDAQGSSRFFPLDDPLIMDINERRTSTQPLFWVDPMETVEARVYPNRSLEIVPHSMGFGSSKRQRGRPKRATPAVARQVTRRTSYGVNGEAHTTWETGRRLGVSSSDDEAVVHEVRKSKRLLLLEGLTPSK
ncbi:unnamed protein product [Amaranthus hypochondriacus]